jgi:hypothetical protein
MNFDGVNVSIFVDSLPGQDGMYKATARFFDTEMAAYGGSVERAYAFGLIEAGNYLLARFPRPAPTCDCGSGAACEIHPDVPSFEVTPEQHRTPGYMDEMREMLRINPSYKPDPGKKSEPDARVTHYYCSRCQEGRLMSDCSTVAGIFCDACDMAGEAMERYQAASAGEQIGASFFSATFLKCGICQSPRIPADMADRDRFYCAACLMREDSRERFMEKFPEKLPFLGWTPETKKWKWPSHQKEIDHRPRPRVADPGRGGDLSQAIKPDFDKILAGPIYTKLPDLSITPEMAHAINEARKEGARWLLGKMRSEITGIPVEHLSTEPEEGDQAQPFDEAAMAAKAECHECREPVTKGNPADFFKEDEPNGF